MSTKRYTITLTFPHMGQNGDVYRIDSVEGSTEFKPGNMLLEREVDELCNRPSWAVKMKRNPETR